MLGFSTISEVPVAAMRDRLVDAQAVASVILDIEPPMLTMITDMSRTVVFTAEIYPGVAADRVVA